MNYMINNYVNKLIENLPNSFKEQKGDNIMKMDLVLDGGAFNGSYMVGPLYFLKEMERRKYIKIERISGCSIGSIFAFLYMIDSLDVIHGLYDEIYNDFKKTYNLEKIKDLHKYFKKSISVNVLRESKKIINKRLFITYYNVKKGKKILRNDYKDNEDIINSMIKSSFIPFIIDGNILYDKKYIDGINPYIFPLKSKSGVKKKVLYLNLIRLDKIDKIFSVKNENTNFHRILTGLLDIHNFYITKSNTQICSYVNDWSIYDNSCNSIRKVFEFLILYIVYISIFFSKYISLDNIIYKIINSVFKVLIQNYCV